MVGVTCLGARVFLAGLWRSQNFYKAALEYARIRREGVNGISTDVVSLPSGPRPPARSAPRDRAARGAAPALGP